MVNHIISVGDLDLYCRERNISSVQLRKHGGVWIVVLVGGFLKVIERDPDLTKAIAAAVTAWEARPSA